MARTPSQNRGSPWSHDTHEILQRGDESVYATALVLAKGRINSVSWMQESSRTIMLGNWLGDKKSLLICLMATTSPVFMFNPFHTRPKAPLPRESPSCWFRNTKMLVNLPWGGDWYLRNFQFGWDQRLVMTEQGLQACHAPPSWSLVFPPSTEASRQGYPSRASFGCASSPRRQ